MNQPSQKAANFRLTGLTTLLVVGFYITLGYIPENTWWGFKHLSFFSPTLRIFYSAILLLLPLSLFLKPIKNFIEGPAVNPPSSVLYLQPLFWLALFIILRTAVHSLGDGYQRASEIESGWIFKPTEFLDFLIHALLYRGLELFGTFRATTAMAVTSITAGFVFVYVLWREKDVAGRYGAVFPWAMIAMGGSQLFFGYVESYTLVYLFGIWYLLLVFRPDKNRAGFVYLTIIYLLAGFSHMLAIILLPSYLLAAHQRFASHQRRMILGAICLSLSLSPFLIPQAISHFVAAESLGGPADLLLPVYGETYSVLSPRHLFDIINQFLLVAPIIFMVLPLLPGALRSKNARPLLLSLVVPALIFIFLFDPKLAMPRDWDLFAFPVIVCAVPIVLLIFRSFNQNPRSVKVPLAAIVLTSLLLMMSWVYINSNRDLHLKRAEYILDHSPRERKYGYELLSYYYSTHHDYENELRMLLSIDPARRTASTYGKISQALYLLERYDEAYKFAHIGANMPSPDRLNAIMAGMTAYDVGKYGEAIYYLRIAAEVTGDDQWRSKMGDAYRMLDSLDKASEIYKQVMISSPQMAWSYFGMAEIYYQRGDFEEAAKYCREGLRRDPQSNRGNQLLRKIEAAEKQ